MKTTLGQIASIRQGYSFRFRLEKDPSGDTAVIQMKDLDARNFVNCTRLVRVHLEGLDEHHYVHPGELVFRSRGLVTTSAILKDDPGRAVVASPLFRILAIPGKILPEYLNWYINQAPAQAFLTTMSSGTSIKMINKDTLEKLEIKVPSLERQRLIVEFATLVEGESLLMKQLASKRNQYILEKIKKFMEGE